MSFSVGLFGGTFNPPHRGHIRAAEQFAAEIAPDLLYIMPSGIPPHKAVETGDNPCHRFRMARLAFSSLPCDTVISAMELTRRGKSYTADTLRTLQALHPGAELFLYVGSDMLFSFESWHDFRWILASCTLVTAPRSDEDRRHIESFCQRLTDLYGCRYRILSLMPLEISSTQLRQEIKDGGRKDLKNYLTAEICGYIMKNRLYDTRSSSKPTCVETLAVSAETLRSMEQALPDVLDENRVRHTLGVRDTALELGRIYLPLLGYEESALSELSAAALCHDMTKNRSETEQVSYLSRFMRCFEGFPAVYHAYASAYFALERYDITPRVFRSIFYHTTGCADMDIFEKIIYLADYIEPNRSHESCRQARKRLYDALSRLKENKAMTAEKALYVLDREILTSLDATYAHLTRENRPVCRLLFDARDFLAAHMPTQQEETL